MEGMAEGWNWVRVAWALAGAAGPEHGWDCWRSSWLMRYPKLDTPGLLSWAFAAMTDEWTATR